MRKSASLNPLPTQFHHLGLKVYGMYTPGLGKSSLLNWQSRARVNLRISPIKTYLRLLDPSTLNVQFLPMHNRPRFTLVGYQTSSEMKSSNVLYFKVIYKPFQPKLEVTAVSTIMTSGNFSSGFLSYIFKKGFWVNWSSKSITIFQSYWCYTRHTIDSNQGEQPSRPRVPLWSGQISGFWIHFMTREIILKAIFLLGSSARSSPVSVGPGWWRR